MVRVLFTSPWKGTCLQVDTPARRRGGPVVLGFWRPWLVRGSGARVCPLCPACLCSRVECVSSGAVERSHVLECPAPARVSLRKPHLDDTVPTPNSPHTQLPSLPFTLLYTPQLSVDFPVSEYLITPEVEMVTQEQPTDEDQNPEDLTVKYSNQHVSPQTTHLTKRTP